MGTKQLTKGNSREKFLRMEIATIRASELQHVGFCLLVQSLGYL